MVNVYGNNLLSSVSQRLMKSQQQDFHVNGEICWAESTVTTNEGNFRSYAWEHSRNLEIKLKNLPIVECRMSGISKHSVQSDHAKERVKSKIMLQSYITGHLGSSTHWVALSSISEDVGEIESLLSCLAWQGEVLLIAADDADIFPSTKAGNAPSRSLKKTLC